MPAPLILFTGTGTGIGKTFLATAAVRAWGATGRAVVGYKPFESGVVRVEDTDGWALEQASTFHVKPSLAPVRLAAPKSPHLAAREEGIALDLRDQAREIARARREAEGVVVELPGGLFSPLTEAALGVDLARLLDPTCLVLVAPDRLGVLHDVLSTTEAARARGVRIERVLMSPTRDVDASTGSNAAELRRLLPGTPISEAAPWGDLTPRGVSDLVAAVVGLG